MKSQIAISAVIGIFLFVLFFSAYYPDANFIAIGLSFLPFLWVVLAFMILKDTSGNDRPADDPDFYPLPEQKS